MPTITVEPTPTDAVPPPRTGPPRPLRRWGVFLHPLGALLTLVTAVVVIYAPALNGELFWDDNPLVKGNGLIRSPLFCLEAFRHTLFDDHSNFYRPVQTLTYLFDYWCWGLTPFGYHLTNVGLHALDGFLLFALLRRVLPALVPAPDDAPPTLSARRPGTDRAALVLASVWTLHPVHNAAVAYVAGRADSLAMGCCLAAWLLCERACEARHPLARLGGAAGAFLSLLAGLCSKEIAFVWLILYGGWLFAPRPGTSRHRSLPEKLLPAAAGLLALGLYLGLRGLPPPSPLPPTLPVAHLPARWLLMLRALGDYGRLLLFPGRLFMNREVFAAPGLANPASPSLYRALAAAGTLVLVAFAVGAGWPGRGRTLRRAGVVWFLVGFLPISNLFSLNASVAEHWLYLPSIGFLLFLAGVALDVPWRRLPAGWRTPRVAVGVLLLVAAALGLRTWLRAHDWATALGFYQQTIRDGGDFPRAREGLAQAYRERGDDPHAAELFADVAARYPMEFNARVNLATTLAHQGLTAEARARLEVVSGELLASADRRAGPREFALTIRALDRLEPAADSAWARRRRALLERAGPLFPNSWDLLQIRLADRENAHDLAGALDLVTAYRDARWWHAPAQFASGRLLALLGRTDEALAAWTQAARLDLRDPGALSAAAVLCLEQGRGAEARRFQEQAVGRQPADPRQHLVLARILAATGQTMEAVRERETAATLAKSSEP